MITEEFFKSVIMDKCSSITEDDFDLVTGPGRSGAIAAVYVSHVTGIPFTPYKHKVDGKRFLIVDTVECTGKTMKKAVNWYGESAQGLTFFQFDHKVYFWYERNAS